MSAEVATAYTRRELSFPFTCRQYIYILGREREGKDLSFNHVCACLSIVLSNCHHQYPSFLSFSRLTFFFVMMAKLFSHNQKEKETHHVFCSILVDVQLRIGNDRQAFVWSLLIVSSRSIQSSDDIFLFIYPKSLGRVSLGRSSSFLLLLLLLLLFSI